MIHYATPDFDFSKIHLSKAVPLQNGSFYTKVHYTLAEEPLFVYTPKCKSKAGLVTSGNKKYVDLMFSANNTNLMEWCHNLEERLQALIFEKKDAWFSEDIELDDIQTVFIPLIKIFKGNNYVLRSYIQQGRNKIPNNTVQVYTEDETPRELSDIKESTDLISILDIQGIKFSQKSFQVNVVVKQIMMLEHTPTFNQCLIKRQKEKEPEIKVEAEVKVEFEPEPDPEPEPEPEPKRSEKQLEVHINDPFSEVDVQPDDDPAITLKKPSEVYSDIYRSTLEKAKRAKQEAAESFKIAQQIKQQHLDLEDEDSDSEY
jgi:hypothetical protein